MFVDFNILNQLGSPSINSNTFANRPSAGQVGRLFVSTDTFEIYRDNGTGWDLIGGPGSSTVTGSGAAGQVTYWTGTNSVGGENNLWWDAANNRFGVNTNTPTAAAEVVQTDGVALYSNFTTNAGSGTGTTALWAINNTNSSGYAAVIEEKTPNTTAGQYPLVVKHSLSSGTAGVGMGTGLHFQLPDDAGTYKTTQLTIETIDSAAATYKTRYRFMVQNNGSSTAVAYLNSTGLGLFTATPGAALDIHSTGVIAQLNSTGATNNGYLAFQRSGTGVWRIGDTYNGGNNYFELHNTVLTSNAIEVTAASNEALFVSAKTYTTGNAIGVAVRHNLTIPNGTNVGLAAIGGVNSNLNLILGGSTTIANTGRQGLEGSTTINFTGAGTLTMTQGTTLRALSALSTVYAFNGSAVGTITHLAGMRICFPDNPGSAVNITNNYGILINDQTTGTGTVTYTNRWGIYQEGASDLNYFAANTLIGTTVNAGYKLDVNGTGRFSGNLIDNINAADTSQLTLINNFASTQFSHIGSFAGNTYISTNWYFNGGAAYDDATKNSSSIVLNGDGTIDVNTANAGGTAPTTRIKVIATGLVGIGTNTPSGLLQLNGVLATPGDAANITIKQSGTTYTDGIYLERTGERNGYYMYIGGSTDSLNFRRNYFGSQTDVLSLNREGYILTNGLGAPVGTAISTAVQIKNASGGTASNGYGIVSANNEFSGGTVLQSSSTNAIGIFADPDNLRGSSSIDFFVDDAVTSRMRVNNTGNVLIGTTTDAGQKLQVAGNILSEVSSNSTQLQLKAPTKQTTIANLQNDSITAGMVRINVPASTTTNLADGYGGAIAMISTTGLAAPNDYQYTFLVTWAWSIATVLFSNSYGANTFTATFTASNGILQVNHNGGASINFSVSVIGVKAPFSQ